MDLIIIVIVKGEDSSSITIYLRNPRVLNHSQLIKGFYSLNLKTELYYWDSSMCKKLSRQLCTRVEV
jgi:hypothetical protein